MRTSDLIDGGNIAESSSKDWNYFNFPSCLGTKLVPDGNGNFELLIVVSATMLGDALIAC